MEKEGLKFRRHRGKNDSQFVCTLLCPRFPIGVTCAAVFGFVWLFLLEHPDPISIPHYDLGVKVFAMSTLIKLLGEPMRMASQILLYPRIRVILTMANYVVKGNNR